MNFNKILLSFFVVAFLSSGNLAASPWGGFKARVSGVRTKVARVFGRGRSVAPMDQAPLSANSGTQKTAATKQPFFRRTSTVTPAHLEGSGGFSAIQESSIAASAGVSGIAPSAYKSVQMGNVNETPAERAARYRLNAALLRSEAQVHAGKAIVNNNEARARQYDAFAAKEDAANKASRGLAAPL